MNRILNLKAKYVSLAPAFLLSACLTDPVLETDHSEEAHKADGHDHGQVYQKPGAAVQFNHNYDGFSVPGISETVLLEFSEQYDAGVLTISLSADEGLDVTSSVMSESFSLIDNSIKQMQIDLSADTEGRYYLDIFAEVIDGNGEVSSRVFGLAYQVGEVSAASISSEAEIEKGIRGENLIILPAEETISD